MRNYVYDSRIKSGHEVAIAHGDSDGPVAVAEASIASVIDLRVLFSFLGKERLVLPEAQGVHDR